METKKRITRSPFISLSLFSPSQTLAVTHFFFFFLLEGWFRVNFDAKITSPRCFFFYLNWICDFTYFSVFLRWFLWFNRLWTTLFVLIFRLCAVCFWFPILVRCLFDSGWKISFEQVQIRSMTMTLASSTLQIWWHEYSGDLNIVILIILVGICTLPFYVINMDDVSMFTDSSFLFLANLDLYYIDVLYQFEWMNIVYFCQKKKWLVETLTPLYGCHVILLFLFRWRQPLLRCHDLWFIIFNTSCAGESLFILEIYFILIC